MQARRHKEASEGVHANHQCGDDLAGSERTCNRSKDASSPSATAGIPCFLLLCSLNPIRQLLRRALSCCTQRLQRLSEQSTSVTTPETGRATESTLFSGSPCLECSSWKGSPLPQTPLMLFS